jgi:hypothetical protein
MKKIFLTIFITTNLFYSLIAQWENVTPSIQLPVFPSVGMDLKKGFITGENGNLYLCIRGFGLFKSVNNGESWLNINSSITGQAAICQKGNKLFVIGSRLNNTMNNVFVSNDDGISWSSYTVFGNSTYGNAIEYINDTLYAAIGGTGTAANFYYSADDGDTWGDMMASPSSNVLDLAYDGNFLFGSQQYKGVYQFYRLNQWQFTNTLLTNDGMSPCNNLPCTGKIKYINNQLYMTNTLGVHRFNSALNVWEQVFSGIANTLEYYNDTLIVGTNMMGIYYSHNDGQDWIQSNSGLENSTFSSNLNNIRSSTLKSDTIFVVTFNGEVFRRKINNLSQSSTGTVISINDANRVFVHPNPSNTIVTLQVGNITSNTLAEIFDVTGQAMKSIHINNLDTNIDVSDLKNGIYFIKVHDSNGFLTARFVKG